MLWLDFCLVLKLIKMDVFIILIFLVVFALSVMFLSKPRRLPPGPMAFPFVGCISILRQCTKKRPHLVLYEAAKKYGDIMSLQIGQTLVVVLTGYDVIHEALVKQADVFSDRPYLPIVEPLMKNGRGIIFQNGHQWKSMRRFTLQTLRDFGVGKSSIEERILAEVDAASKGLEETKDTPVRISPLLYNVAGNVIYGIIFGQRYDYDDPTFEMISKLTNSVAGGQGAISPANFFPDWLMKLIAVETDKADIIREQACNEIDEFLLEKIKEHEETYDENNIRDFVDLYIQVTRENVENTDDSEDIYTKGNMLRTIQDLFLAGTETSATTLDWAFLYMIEHPEIQRKCQLEIEQVVGERPIAYSDRANLPFVDATIMEVQRISTLVPPSLPHCTTKDTELMGYKIPKGTLILPMIYSASFDTKYWKEPEMFRPERFLNREGKVAKQDANIPFSVGPRICLGEPLARMELFLVFSNLLQRFKFSKENENVKHTMESKVAQITNSPLEYKLRAFPRHRTST